MYITKTNHIVEKIYKTIINVKNNCNIYIYICNCILKNIYKLEIL